mmetsp:Transcript_26750/g.67073  ORF Transcript_26750/g.67073 Transcript_26750/m.67073 type:complete len:182 (-) Transcript_26750:1160-1705(-)
MLHGGPGMGKTETAKCLIAALERLKKRSTRVASMYGIAAQHAGGKTVYNLLGMSPRDQKPWQREGLRPSSVKVMAKLQERWNNGESIFFDEFETIGTTMLHNIHARACAQQGAVRRAQRDWVLRFSAIRAHWRYATRLRMQDRTISSTVHSMSADEFDWDELTTQHRVQGRDTEAERRHHD